jgi:hypothetical protein
MADPIPQPALSPQMGWSGRGGFVLAAAVAVGVPTASLVAAFVAPRSGWCGVPFAAAAVLLAAFNWYLAFRPAFYRRRYGSLEGFRRTSGAPLVGNLFAFLGALLGWGDWWAAVPEVVAVSLDPGGLPWFVVTMIRTRQF